MDKPQGFPFLPAGKEMTIAVFPGDFFLCFKERPT
jgi:hypothetical protein